MKRHIRLDTLEARFAVAEALLPPAAWKVLRECLHVAIRLGKRFDARASVHKEHIEDALEAALQRGAELASLEHWALAMSCILPEEFADVGSPLEATTALPGSQAKEVVFQSRLADGRSLHHDQDPQVPTDGQAADSRFRKRVKSEEMKARARATGRYSRGYLEYELTVQGEEREAVGTIERTYRPSSRRNPVHIRRHDRLNASES